VSSAAGPAGGARLAAVGAQVTAGGRTLSVAPDTAMLASPSTRYPVFVDPDFTISGAKQDYDPVQSGSTCTGSHYNSSSYTSSPVGYDNFQKGSCQDEDTDYALYQVAVPNQDSGLALLGPDSTANLLSASFQIAEDYTSSCSADPQVTVSWIGKIGPSTGWSGPALNPDDVDATKAVGPDSGSCDNTVNNSKTVAAGFNVLPDIKAATTPVTSWTFRVWIKNDTNTANHKQLTDNPDLQIVYIDTPNTPDNLEAASGSNGSGSVACDTNAADPNLPAVGASDSTNGIYILGNYTTDDSNTVTGTVMYWNNATPSATADVTTDTGTGTLWAQIPASFSAGMADGTVVGYQAEASVTVGSTYTSAWSAPCYVAVYPTAPNPPAVTADFNVATAQPIGNVSFTITQSAGDNASEFVWGLDVMPPTSGTIPAGQTCTSSSATCTLSGGTATLTITLPSPGPHYLWVYEDDAGGNSPSSDTSVTFTGASDQAFSYISGSTLAANFAAALAAGKPFDNTMISTQAGAPGTADGDGYGNSVDEAQLASAGWQPGKPVTVDGATFGLPSFGTSSSGPDNLLAANQTIGAGPNAQGSAVVFLATSTNADVQVGGLMTGSPDAGAAQSDYTVPGVMGGTPVSGHGCTDATVFNTTQSGCIPAQGQVNYAAGCAAGSFSLYDLTAPDWVEGPSDLAAVSTPDSDSSNGQQANNPKIYAFAVAVDPACTVTSVTLPDIGDTVLATVSMADGGVTTQLAGLHIFGIALRNTATATPQAGGTSAALASGTWTGAFESPAEDAFGPPASVTWGDQTVRLAVSPNVSVPAGAQIRLRLSDPGFLSQDGDGPLTIGAATIAVQSTGPVPAQTPVSLTFSSSAAVTIPEGGDIYTDPLALPFAVTAGKDLLVSLWIENSSPPMLPENTLASGAQTWIAKAGTGSLTQARDTTGTPFTGTGTALIASTILLTGVDVTTDGDSTAVVAGDNLIDAASSDAPSDAANAPSQRLAGQLLSQGQAAGFGPVDAGIESNQLLADGGGAGGVSLIARLDRDILAEPDVGTVLLDQGLEDLLRNTSMPPSDIDDALEAVTAQLNNFGVSVIVATLTPCSGYDNSVTGDSCTSAADSTRTQVNTVLGLFIGFPNCVADFNSAVSNGQTPQALSPSYDSGDHANLSFAGYEAAAGAVPAAGCSLSPNSLQ
jgi:hypothetical protein